MPTNARRGTLDAYARLRRVAAASRSEDRCLVAPHPELQAKLRAEIEEMRGSASAPLARLLKAREMNRVGFNDGLILPGSYFPVGTPAHRVRSVAADRAPLRGTVRVAVVLVDFSDEGFAASHDNQYYHDLFFSEGVLANGSVREYFTDVTGGLVRITGEVVGPYRLPDTLAHYANGGSGIGNTTPNARDMAAAAADAANADVDFGVYDNDGDGFVDAFIVLQAGPGAESTGSGGHIWSHKWVLRATYDADGTSIYGYLIVPEEARIGVCCHELGHLLFGFPDLYDSDYSSSGIGDWCLMGGGSWNGGGDVPAHPSAWCKANQEWVTVLNQASNSVESIRDVKDSRSVYRLWKDGAAGDEYFLVENRQQAGYDAHIPGSGLLIWHVDDAVSSNADETHPKVALVQADDRRDLENGDNRGDGGDPYPGDSGNTAFNDASSPSSRSYGDLDTCVAVEAISAPGPVMTAQLKVSCRIAKSVTADKAVKEWKKETVKDFFKDVIKERTKEHHKDFKEKEFKEDKEWKERKEWKEWKEKDFEGAPSGPGVPPVVPEHPGTLEARLAALEDRLSAITPFIHTGLRPDLRMSALAAEQDVSRAQEELRRRGARARAASAKTRSRSAKSGERKEKTPSRKRSSKRRS